MTKYITFLSSHVTDGHGSEENGEKKFDWKKINKTNSTLLRKAFFFLLPQQGGSCYITLAGLKFALVLLTLPARCWDYRYVPLT